MKLLKKWFDRWYINQSIRNIEYIIANGDYFQLVSARKNQVKYFLMKKSNYQLKHYYLEFIGNGKVILHCEWFIEFYFIIDISMLSDDILIAVIEKDVDEIYYTNIYTELKSLSDKLKIELVDRM